MIFIIIYIMIVNTISFILFGLDKRYAKYNQWRIEESTLILSAIIGGGIGAYIGMHGYKHKTQHKKFQIIIPLLATIQIIAIFIILTI